MRYARSLRRRLATALSILFLVGGVLAVSSGPAAAAVPEARDDAYVVTGGTTLDVTAEHSLDLVVGPWGVGSGFVDPKGIAVDAFGDLYVVASRYGRVKKVASDGTLLTEWGSEGIGNGQFAGPSGVAIGAARSIYVVDSWNHRIQQFTSAGIFVNKWGGLGDGAGKFNNPTAIAIDAAGFVYVADAGNRIQKFTSDGVFVTEWGGGGSADGEFARVAGVAVDAEGYVYATDRALDRVQKFTSDGVYVTQWGSSGDFVGELEVPLGIGLDPAGSVYVADSHNARVQQFTSEGVYTTQWGSWGKGDGQMRDPWGVAADSMGRVYVSEFTGNRVQRFTMAGVLNNDSDPDHEALAATLVSGPHSGTLTLNSDGSFSYTPNDGFVGKDTFTYTASDGTATSDTATVTIAVEPPPPSFTDDDGSIFEGDIEWLAAQGITRGCNPPSSTLFCPNAPVTRGQMAAFLVRALGYSDDGGGDLFTDDDDSIFEGDIDRLGTAAVTSGCNPPLNTLFCPDAPVTRGQMAAFLVRALGYSDDGGGDLFTDDDDSIFEGDIDRLGTAGVTRGCNPPLNTMFCPDDFVTRSQMAAFLQRALRHAD